jgi:hypothetical protein
MINSEKYKEKDRVRHMRISSQIESNRLVLKPTGNVRRNN